MRHPETGISIFGPLLRRECSWRWATVSAKHMASPPRSGSKSCVTLLRENSRRFTPTTTSDLGDNQEQRIASRSLRTPSLRLRETKNTKCNHRCVRLSKSEKQILKFIYEEYYVGKFGFAWPATWP